MLLLYNTLNVTFNVKEKSLSVFYFQLGSTWTLPVHLTHSGTADAVSSAMMWIASRKLAEGATIDAPLRISGTAAELQVICSTV